MGNEVIVSRMIAYQLQIVDRLDSITWGVFVCFLLLCVILFKIFRGENGR